MRLKNYTNVPTETLREIVRFVKPASVASFDISFKNCGGKLRGRAYSEGCAYHEIAAPLVVVSISKNPADFPHRLNERGRGYLPVDIYTRLEAFVFITAHELRHLWQGRHPRGHRVWGARGQFSERDADAYAIRSLRLWRREH